MPPKLRSAQPGSYRSLGLDKSLPGTGKTPARHKRCPPPEPHRLLASALFTLIPRGDRGAPRVSIGDHSKVASPRTALGTESPLEWAGVTASVSPGAGGCGIMVLPPGLRSPPPHAAGLAPRAGRCSPDPSPEEPPGRRHPRSPSSLGRAPAKSKTKTGAAPAPAPGAGGEELPVPVPRPGPAPPMRCDRIRPEPRRAAPPLSCLSPPAPGCGRRSRSRPAAARCISSPGSAT